MSDSATAAAPVDAATTLVARVRRRVYLGRLLRRGAWAVFGGLLVGAAAVLATRLTGTLPLGESRWLLLAGPAVALLGVVLLTRRPKAETSARLIDERAATGDLFLTNATLRNLPGSYEPLVAARASEQAEVIEPKTIVDPGDRLPWKWLAAGLLLAWAADFFTPLMDPFGTVAAAENEERMEEQIDRDLEEIRMRKAELARDDDGAADELSPEVQAALEQFDTTMAEMKPQEPEQNKADIAQTQRQMSKLWEQAREKLSKELTERNARGQKFGGESAQKQKEWKEQLAKGDPEGLLDELEQIRELLEEAAQQDGGDTAEGQQAAQEKRDELLREAEQKMADLKDFAEQEIGSEELAQAMQKALQQMDAAQTEELAERAMEAMREAGELSEQEVEQIAQAARDLEAVEDALETLQEMKQMQARNEGEFDPSECEDCETAEDYEQFYKEQLAQQEGGGGRGERDGTEPFEAVAEQDVVSEGFKKEQANSYVEKGEMLMTLSGRGEGTMNADEQREFQAVRKALSQEAIEAIELEDIPPGYQDKIKSYFRAMDAE